VSGQSLPLVLEGMAERQMGYIMHKGGGPYYLLILSGYLGTVGTERICHARGHVQGTHGVQESRVCCTWINEICRPKLLYASQSLKLFKTRLYLVRSVVGLEQYSTVTYRSSFCFHGSCFRAVLDHPMHRTPSSLFTVKFVKLFGSCSSST